MGAIEKKLVLLESIPAPVEPGQKAGVLEYSLGGKKLGEVNVLTNGSIREAGYYGLFEEACGSLEAEPAVGGNCMGIRRLSSWGGRPFLRDGKSTNYIKQ